MDINELESFKMSDAIKFHDELNPNLWNNDKLDPEVRKQLLLIAEDFITTLGIKDLAVKDITVSGSNAAYTYTPHSDLDLHVLVDFNELPNNEVYQELFNAKKIIYNDSHDITVHGVPVELYVQDTNLPVVSLGEYSVLNDKWIRIPKKQKANLDQEATRAKFDKLAELVELALQTRDPDRVAKTLDTIKRYRKAGLANGGEFSPENLAFKAIRKQGAIQDLYDLKNELHSEKLSIEEAASREDAILKIKKLRNLKGRTPNEVENVKRIVTNLMKQWNIDPEEIGIKQKVDPLQAKIAKAAYEKNTAANMFKQEWERFKKGIFAEQETDEDYDPNGPPPGPEFKPTMPAGTVKVDVSDVYDWYKLGQHISNMKGLGKHDFGKGPPSTILSFGDEDTEHEYINDLEKTGLTTTDIDPVDPKQPKGMKRQKTDPTYNVNEDSDYNQYEGEIEDFVQSLNPDDVGVEQIGPYHVHFEGFTDECQEHAQERCELPPSDPRHLATYDDVYKEVISDFVRREGGKKPLKVGFAGYDDYPIIYAVFHNPEPYKNPDAWNPFNVNETADRTAAVLKIQKHLNKKYGANLDLDGKLGPLTLKSINKFMPRAKKGLADEPNKTTAVQGKKLKESSGTKIDAHRVGDTIWINYFEVPVKGKGLGRTEYEKFEKSLPKDIKKIRLVASDAGYGPTHDFWDRMGFDYAYPDDDNEMVKLLEASGYIPSEKEKNDPRFKTALTKDVRPNANKKNAAAFGWKVSRAGIPPQARPDGKIK